MKGDFAWKMVSQKLPGLTYNWAYKLLQFNFGVDKLETYHKNALPLNICFVGQRQN